MDLLPVLPQCRGCGSRFECPVFAYWEDCPMPPELDFDLTRIERFALVFGGA